MQIRNSKQIDESPNNVSIQKLKNYSSNMNIFRSSQDTPSSKDLICPQYTKVLLKKVGFKDYFLFFFRCGKSKGTYIINLSEQITVQSLSCDNIIKNNMNQQKLIELLDEAKKEQFYQLKPEMIKQLEKQNLILNFIEKKQTKKKKKSLNN